MAEPRPNGREHRTDRTDATEATQAAAAYLIEVHGLDPGRRVQLHRAPLLLGRSSKCDVRIDQAVVSRMHARIRPTEAGWLLEDLGSTHGTWLDAIPVHRALLGHGDRLRLGHTVLRFLSQPPLEAALHLAIHRLVTRDGLTDLLNRSAFLEAMEREVARARRHRRPLSLIAFDLRIPPEVGEVESDLVLETAARRAAREVRVEDVLGLLEGATFLALLPEVGAAGAEVMGNRIAARIGRPFSWAPDAPRVEVRVARAELGPEVGAAEDLLQALTTARLG